MSEALRIRALDLAHSTELSADQVVVRAGLYLAFLLGNSADVATPPAKTTKTKAGEPKVEDPKGGDSPETVDEKPEADEAPAVDYAEVKKYILGISSKIGRDAATKLLGEFGVEKGPDLKPADYAAFVAKAEPLLAGA